MRPRVLHRAHASWFVVRRLGRLTRSVGLRRLLRVVGAHLVGGMRIESLGIWCHDQLAFLQRDDAELYECWIDTVEARPEPASVDEPTAGVSVALAVADTRHLGRTLESLERQTHHDHRLVVAVPAPQLSSIARQLPSSARVVAGPPAASQQTLLAAALAAAKTEYALSLLPGAVLAPHALAELSRAAVDADADLVYADEDALRDGRRRDPWFKPGASPDLQDAIDYVGPVCLLRVGGAAAAPERVRRLGLRGLVADLLHGDAVVRRVPRVLVHWLGGRDRTLSEPSPGRTPPPRLATSVVVPTRDGVDLLRRCIPSLYRHAPAGAFEVLILDNGSRGADTRRWLEAAPDRWPDLRVLDADYAFNWSRICNQGAREARGEVCLFVNDDVEATRPGWLEILSEQARREEIGAVGALLLYPDGAIQHAGIVMAMGGVAGHVYAGCPTSETEGFPFVAPTTRRNVLAVTGACLAVERGKLLEVGGFDEGFPICGDVDLCLRLHAAGRRNLYEPAAQLLHRESATRGRAPLSRDESTRLLEVFASRVGTEDPFYNPNLNLRSLFPTFLQPFRARRG